MNRSGRPDYFRIFIILVITFLVGYGLIYMLFFSDMFKDVYSGF
mgnify:CR=1 FL=1